MHDTNSRGDTGERLFSYKLNPDGRVARQQLGESPRILDWELTDIHNRITGEREAGFVIRGPGSRHATEGKAVEVGSARELESYLQLMKDREQHTGVKEFPLILVVDTGH